MNAQELREQLIMDVGSSAVWRAEKAEEYPDDERNAQAATELTKLEKALKNLPSNDPRFDTIERADKVLVEDDCYPMEELDQYKSRIGFDELADADSFLSGYMGILTAALADDTGNAKKAWENRLRRAVGRHGYVLRKSRVRDSYAPTHGMYWIVDPETNFIAVYGGYDNALDLIDVEAWIKTPEGEEIVTF